MFKKLKKLLFLLDFSGTSPNLRILNNNNYKSILSSIISIIIIIISLSFVVYSIIDFANQNPIISYYKNIDNNINKTFQISDSFLMFKFTLYSQCVEDDYQGKYMSHYINGELKNEFELEKCELGKNIDLKYKNIIEDFEKDNNENISNYLCPNYRGEKISISDKQNNVSYLSLFISKNIKENCSNIDPFYLIEIVSENDIINHKNKKDPCIQSYHRQYIYSNDNIELFDIEYNFNYIRYDNDNGLFFQKYTSQDLITFSDVVYNHLNSYNPRQLSFYIEFKINKSYYDHYIRTYTKIQSLLADVANIINLLILFGKILSSFLLDKQMSRDIFQTIITNDKIINNDINLINLTFEKDRFNKNEEIKMRDFSFNRDNRNKYESNTTTTNSDFIIKEKQNNIEKLTKIKILNNLKFFDFFKSHFCFKSIKYKLIDSCHDLFKEEICIDSILKRLYDLENHIFIRTDKTKAINKNKNQYELIDEHLSFLLKEKIYGKNINIKINENKN